MIGKLESSTGFYNEPENLDKAYKDTEKGLLEWAEDNMGKHPEFSMFVHHCHSNLDYIFYCPSTMRVKKILEIPTKEEVTKEIDLPSRLFPSDHIRMQTQFEVYFPK